MKGGKKSQKLNMFNLTLIVGGTVRFAGVFWDKPAKVVLKVIDVLGRMVETKEVSPNQTINIGSLYRPGIYVVQAVQGNIRRELKLNKIPD
jgi:hypothetical protein